MALWGVGGSRRSARLGRQQPRGRRRGPISTPLVIAGLADVLHSPRFICRRAVASCRARRPRRRPLTVVTYSNIGSRRIMNLAVQQRWPKYRGTGNLVSSDVDLCRALPADPLVRLVILGFGALPAMGVAGGATGILTLLRLGSLAFVDTSGPARRGSARLLETRLSGRCPRHPCGLACRHH